MTFSEKFKRERIRLGLTQQELAEQLHLSRKTIVAYESGKSIPRTVEGYRTIADFFGKNKSYFLNEDDEFIVQAAEQYGQKGMAQAKQLLEGMSGLFAGGSLSEQDKDAVMYAMQQIYWDAKGRNREKYGRKAGKSKG